MATIHLRPMEEERSGQQQQADFLEEDGELLMSGSL
jgi:hypothetical protein